MSTEYSVALKLQANTSVLDQVNTKLLLVKKSLAQLETIQISPNIDASVIAGAQKLLDIGTKQLNVQKYINAELAKEKSLLDQLAQRQQSANRGTRSSGNRNDIQNLKSAQNQADQLAQAFDRVAQAQNSAFSGASQITLTTQNLGALTAQALTATGQINALANQLQQVGIAAQTGPSSTLGESDLRQQTSLLQAQLDALSAMQQVVKATVADRQNQLSVERSISQEQQTGARAVRATATTTTRRPAQTVAVPQVAAGNSGQLSLDLGAAAAGANQIAAGAGAAAAQLQAGAGAAQALGAAMVPTQQTTMSWTRFLIQGRELLEEIKVKQDQETAAVLRTKEARQMALRALQTEEKIQAVLARNEQARSRSQGIQAGVGAALSTAAIPGQSIFQAGAIGAAVGGKTAAVAGVAAASAIALGGFTVQATKTSIEIGTLEQRIELLSKGFDGYSQVLGQAQASGKKFGQTQQESLDAFSKAYGRLRPMGMSLQQITTIYEGFNTAARLAGASTQESAGAFNQLLQAMGSGALRGEELNSILEQAPLVALEIANALGTTVGNLKTFGEQGKITGDTVMTALTNIRKEGGDKLAATLNTPAQKVKNLQIAWEKLELAATKALLPSVTKGLEGLAKTMEAAVPVFSAVGSGLANAMEVLGLVGQALSLIPAPVLDILGKVAGLLAQVLLLNLAFKALAGMKVALSAFFVQAAAGATTTGTAALTATGRVSALAGALKGLAAIGLISITIELLIKEIGGALKNIEDAKKNNEKREKQRNGGMAKQFKGSSREGVIASQAGQKVELEKILKEREQLKKELKKSREFGMDDLFDMNKASKTSNLLNRMDSNKLREKDARAILGLNPNNYKEGKKVANWDGTGGAKAAQKLYEEEQKRIDRAEALKRQGIQLDRQTQDLRIQTEDQILGLRRRAEDLTRANVDLRRSVEADIFAKQQEIARLNSDNLRAQDQLKTDKLDSSLNSLKLDGAAPGADFANGLVSAVQQYTSARSNAEADLRQKERAFSIEMIDLKKASDNYNFELKRKIADMNRQSDDYTRDVEKAKLTAERAIYDWQIAAADYQLEKAKQRISLEQDAALAAAAPTANAGSAGGGAAIADTALTAIQKANLMTIRYAEGTAGAKGYQTMFGGGTFTDMSKHPNKVIRSGGYASAAAGAYQFMPDTAKRIGLKTMDPIAQDRAAIKLMEERGVDSKKPMTKESMAKLAPEWASFPKLNNKSFYNQPVKKQADLQAYFNNQLKTLNAPAPAPAAGVGVAGGINAASIEKATVATAKFTGITNMCAETVKEFYKSMGIVLPGVNKLADSTKNAGTVMRDWSKLKVGDIVNKTNSSGVSTHTGVYTGGQNVFHQSSSRGKTAGNFPDLGYFKNQGYFVRPTSAANQLKNAQAGSEAASTRSGNAAAAGAAGGGPDFANTMAALNALKAPAPIDLSQLTLMKASLDASLIAAKQLGLALAKDFAAMSKEKAAETLTASVKAQITQLTAPLDAIKKAQADQAAYQREYGALISQGVTPALAEQLIKIDQQVQLQLQQLNIGIAQLESTKAKLLAEGKWTEELQAQLDLLNAQKGVIPAKGNAAKDGAKASESFGSKLGTGITEAGEQLNKLMDPANQVKTAAASIGTAFSESFKGVVSGAMTAEQALQNMFQKTADHFLDMAAQMIAKMIEMQAMKLVMSIIGGPAAAVAPTPKLGPGFAAGGTPPVGVPSLVGEQGPELFIPGQTGLVVPNDIFTATRQAIVGGGGGGGGAGDAAFAENQQAIAQSNSVNRERVIQQDFNSAMEAGYEPINVKVDAFDPSAAGLVTIGQLEQSNKMAVAQAQAKIMQKFKNNPAARSGAGLR